MMIFAAGERPTDANASGKRRSQLVIAMSSDKAGQLESIYPIGSKHVAESGQNENGYYTRFWDGTQICWIPTLEKPSTDPVTWTYPKPFVSGTVLPMPSVAHSTNLRIAQASSRLQGSCQIQVWNLEGGGSATNVQVYAIGRWF
jgi:hypothetical protein